MQRVFLPEGGDWLRIAQQLSIHDEAKRRDQGAQASLLPLAVRKQLRAATASVEELMDVIRKSKAS